MRFKGEISTAGSLAFKCCLCKPYPFDCSQTHNHTVVTCRADCVPVHLKSIKIKKHGLTF